MQLFFPRSFEFSLRSTGRATVFLLAIGLAVLFVGGEAIRIGMADTFALSVNLTELRWALALDPGNPKIHRQVGLYFCYLENPSMAEGLAHLRRATELNPRADDYWYSLALACELNADNACADQALERATSLGPMVPRYQWAAANHYLATDRNSEALSHFRRVLELDPGYDWPTFRLCLRITEDPDMVFQNVLPEKDTKLKLSYVNFLSSEGQADSAYRAWTKTITEAAPFPISSAEPYLEHLLALGRGQEARSVWQSLERLGVVEMHGTNDEGDLVFNGNFEQTPLNAGLDWRYQSPPYLTIDFSDPGAYQGKRCLRVDFTVSRNDEYLVVSQFVPVVPNHEYVLQARSRSQNITSDSGPRLQVVDPACPSCVNVSTDTTVGTTPWHKVSLRFSTGPQTQLVFLSLLRPRGRSFPLEITGSFWLDAVSVKDESPANKELVLRSAH